MGDRFYVKIQKNKRSKREKLILVGMFCFILAIVLQILLSNYYALTLLLPLFYLIYLYRHLRGSKHQMSDAICEMFFFHDNFTIKFEPEYGIVKGTCRIKYEDMTAFNIYENGKVEIAFAAGSCGGKEIRNNKQNIVFYMNEEDKEILKERLRKVLQKK